MATMPATQAAPGATTPGDPDAAATPGQAGPQFTVCIEVETDGTFSVSVEGGDGSPQGAPQTAPDVKTALTIALGAIKNNGQMQDMGADDAAFSQGFAGASPQEPQ